MNPHERWCPLRTFVYEVGSGEEIPKCVCRRRQGERRVERARSPAMSEYPGETYEAMLRDFCMVWDCAPTTALDRLIREWRASAPEGSAPEPRPPFALPVRVEKCGDEFNGDSHCVFDVENECVGCYGDRAQADFIAVALNAYQPVGAPPREEEAPARSPRSPADD